MTSALLKCESFVPPLLEKQISPPYRIVVRHLDYLQKWREYLLWTLGRFTVSGSDIQPIKASVNLGKFRDTGLDDGLAKW